MEKSRREQTKKERSQREEEVLKIWVKFKKDGCGELRNQLMEEHLYLVKYNAERIYAKLPDEVELDDLVSAGIFGLMDAINSYDLERGVKFSTYCAPRVRGAILDEMRSMDWVPRLGCRIRPCSRAHKFDRAKSIRPLGERCDHEGDFTGIMAE